MDEYSLFCLESYLDEHAFFNNIGVANLQEIPDYANDQHFVPLPLPKDSFEYERCGPRNVYSRADYARILVLDHCLATCPERNHIIYSDIDCLDVRLPEAIPLMNDHGVAIHDLGPEYVSHGYIGVASDNDAVRSHFGQLKADSRKLAHADDLGYRAFDAYLKRLGMPNRDWHDKIGLPSLLPGVGVRAAKVYYTPQWGFETWQSIFAPANEILGAIFSCNAPPGQTVRAIAPKQADSPAPG